jgi:hypothetical protein
MRINALTWRPTPGRTAWQVCLRVPGSGPVVRLVTHWTCLYCTGRREWYSSLSSYHTHTRRNRRRGSPCDSSLPWGGQLEVKMDKIHVRNFHQGNIDDSIAQRFAYSTPLDTQGLELHLTPDTWHLALRFWHRHSNTFVPAKYVSYTFCLLGALPKTRIVLITKKTIGLTYTRPHNEQSNILRHSSGSCLRLLLKQKYSIS